MNDFFNGIVRGLVTYRVAIFVILIAGILIYIRKFLIGLKQWQTSVFGLERRFAQRSLISATTGLTLIILLLIGEFMLTTLIAPRLPTISGEQSPTVDPFAVATVTLSPEEEAAPAKPTPTVGQESLVSECIEKVVEITFPENGGAVSGTVELIGSVNVDNFGSYKYEFSTTGAVSWTTIAAGNTLKLDESLGFWYTSSLTPGNYLLQLVPLNNAGEALTPCIISVEVVPEEE